MIVYIVVVTDVYDDRSHIEGVYATNEEAEYHIKSKAKFYKQNVYGHILEPYIEEWEVGTFL